ncbi:RING/U-box superfamily protein [Thalictrum thalictroides]|uniref:RING/U-box superfamily protein n=1 Tax=Thalictrum thalictroides TaxID=46969 RepID=A0A7J6VY55_THATH|nr:RING/U-box superfamily protein [Thalictrum thalictroides]
MGAACCVAARDTTSEGLSRNIRHSPTWNYRWDNQRRVADEVDNSSYVHSHGTSGSVWSETKGSIDVECSDLSERQSQLTDIQTPTQQKSPSHEEAGGNSMTYPPVLSLGGSSLTEAKDLTESSAVAASRLFSVPGTSSCSKSKGDSLSSQSHSFLANFTPSSQARQSPEYRLERHVSECLKLDINSPSNSISEGRQRYVLSSCSNDLTMGSQGNRSSDRWSMSTFSELVASSQRERWSFDSETLDGTRGKVTRSKSNFLASPSTDLRTCGVCLKLLMERSPWVGQKFVVSNELSVVAVLVCGHVYHAECLENITPESHRFDPPCPVCTLGDKHSLKIYGKSLKRDTDTKARNRIPRNRVVDSNVDFDYSIPDHLRSTHREGKGPMMGSSSSMKSSFARPFLRRHFSLGSKSTITILENEFVIKSPSAAGSSEDAETIGILEALLWACNKSVTHLILETDHQAAASFLNDSDSSGLSWRSTTILHSVFMLYSRFRVQFTGRTGNQAAHLLAAHANLSAMVPRNYDVPPYFLLSQSREDSLFCNKH